MELRPFRLEAWFDHYEFRAKYVLGSSDCRALTMGELCELADESPPTETTNLGYTPVAGDEALREAIASLYPNTHARDVFVTQGASEAIFLLLSAVSKPGRPIVVGFPAFQSLYDVARGQGAEVRYWRYRPENRFQPDLDELPRLLEGATALVLNNPHNPTGCVLETETLRAIAVMAERAGANLIVDEVFHGLTADGSPADPPARAVAPDSIAIGSLSKVYGLGGLRTGWIVAPQAALEPCRSLKYYTSVCSSALVHRLARMAIKARAKIFLPNQKTVLGNLARLRALVERHPTFRWIPPRGGTVTLVGLPSGVSSDEVCGRLVSEHGVLLVPGGSCFDLEGYVRIGVGRSEDDFATGMDLIDRSFSSL